MRSAVLALAMFAAIATFPAVVSAQATEVVQPPSLERIRAGLSAPGGALVLPETGEIPTFRVEVRQPLWVVGPIEEEPFDPTFGLPSVGELLMGGIQRLHAAAVNYKRRRAERRARKEVDEALAAFCAVHECPAANR